MAVLTREMTEQIKALLPRYPTRQAVTLPALHVVHEKLRCVPREAVVEIADLLELTPADVQDTLSFYQFFHQDRPHGRTRVWVCRSVGCMLRGGEELLEHMCKKAGIQPGQTTKDGRLTIEAAECLGACEYAPCVLANQELHKDVTKTQGERIVHGAR